MNISEDFVWQMFIQLLAVVGVLFGILTGVITWIGKKSLDKLEIVVEKTVSHSVTLGVHTQQITTIEKRQDDFDDDQRRQDDQIYLVTYNKKKTNQR